MLAPADRPVRVRFVDAQTGRAVAVRLHLHGEAGEYLPPRGHHRKVNRVLVRGQLRRVRQRPATSTLRRRRVHRRPAARRRSHVEITAATRSRRCAPPSSVDAGDRELTFELERVLPWRERGWVTADTHVHFLSPQTALLEGAAEGVNVVNLLASQWGEMFSNVGDFDGRRRSAPRTSAATASSSCASAPRTGCRCSGTSRCSATAGALIHPLCTGGPDESALGDPLEVTMAEWAERCIDQGGLVVMPHAPNPQLERAADIVLGLVARDRADDLQPATCTARQLNPYGLADWYRYLNLGLPHAAGRRLGQDGGLDAARRHPHLRATRRARAHLRELDGRRPRREHVRHRRPAGVAPRRRRRARRPGRAARGGGTVARRLGGRVGRACRSSRSRSSPAGSSPSRSNVRRCAVGERQRVRRRRPSRPGSRCASAAATAVDPDDIAAHTSAVQVLVDGSPLFSEADAMTVLDQIQGAIAYVDTLAPRPEARRFQRAARDARERLQPPAPAHARRRDLPPHPLHDPARPHEH